MVTGAFTQTLNGLQYGFILFLIASGITISLGVLNLVNMAHGELYTLGAFIAASVVGFIISSLGFVPGQTSPLLFLGILVGGMVASGVLLYVIGFLFESALFRPIYGRDLLYQLVLTFGVLLIVRDVIQLYWGRQPKSASQLYQGINSLPTTELLGLSYPSFNVIAILIGTVVFVLMLWFFDRTDQGRLIRTVAIDREMSAAIGVDVSRTYTHVFALSALLAGLAGGLIIPQTGATIGIGDTPLVHSFVVVVIGGIGSVRGSLVGALAVGLATTWMTVIYPLLEFAAPYLLMIAILLLKPDGLFKSWGEL